MVLTNSAIPLLHVSSEVCANGADLKAAEKWGGTPLIQLVLEAPHLYFTRHERGWGSRGARCGVVGCLFVGDSCPTRTLALHYYLHHFNQLKVILPGGLRL